MSTAPEPVPEPVPDTALPADDTHVELAGPNPWLVLVILGVLFAGLGIWLIFSTRASQATVAILLAIGLFLSGLNEFVWAGDRRKPWVGFVLGGLFLLGGMAVLLETNASLKVFATVIGACLITVGVFQMAAAVIGRDELRHWVWMLVFGLFTVAIGVAAIVWPSATIRVIGLLVGIRLLIIGLGSIGLGATMRSLR